MADLETNIKQAISDFDNIQRALEENGVPIPYDTDTSTYGNKIRQNLLNQNNFYTKQATDELLDEIKTTYDTNDDGVVDDSDKLGGQLPSYYAKAVDVPTKTSELENDEGFLTEHQDISGKADKATTLAGYGITDAYTKTETNDHLAEYVKRNDILQTSNCYGGPKLYISKIDNGFYAGNKRYTVAAKIYNNDGTFVEDLSESQKDSLFNGNYDENILISSGTYLVVNIFFGNVVYPFGDYLVSTYYTSIPRTATCRMRAKRTPASELEWINLPTEYLMGSETATQNVTYKFTPSFMVYDMEQIEFTIYTKDGVNARISEIEFNPSRVKDSPMVSKGKAETLYFPLTAPSFIGDLNGTATKAASDGDGNDITETYATKAELETAVGDMEAALNEIISLLNQHIGGDSA